jgi:hypothetical protein
MFFAGFGVGSFGGWFSGVIAERWETSGVYVALAGVTLITLLLSGALAVRAASRTRMTAPASSTTGS